MTSPIENRSPAVRPREADALIEAVARRAAEIVIEGMQQLGDSPQFPDDGYLNLAQAADYLAAKPSRIYELVARNELEVGRDGRRLLFKREWLDAVVVGPLPSRCPPSAKAHR